MTFRWSRLSQAVVLCIGLALAGCTSLTDTSRTFETVVIDAGHGGHDSGARSRRGVAEKTVALDTAQRVESKLRAAGFRTVMTRNSDVFVPLDSRVAIGNRQRNAIFVSIHYNHTRRRAVHGVETYYKSPYARSLAVRVANHVSGKAGLANRGPHTANFRVIKKARYPSVLVECGYLSNAREASRCASAAHRDRIADAIVAAILEQRGRRR
jgi:N-acetylmuramoyl-L-alanine amidase